MSSSCEDELWCGDGASGGSAEAEVEVLRGVQVLSSPMISIELPHCGYSRGPIMRHCALLMLQQIEVEAE